MWSFLYFGCRSNIGLSQELELKQSLKKKSAGLFFSVACMVVRCHLRYEDFRDSLLKTSPPNTHCGPGSSSILFQLNPNLMSLRLYFPTDLCRLPLEGALETSLALKKIEV